MILNFIFSSIIGIVKALFTVFPTLPATPSAVTTAGSWVTDTIASVASVLQLIFGTTLLTAIILIVVSIFSFETVYHSVMWVVRKIPFLNVK
jgi:hypothetical protein